jgi:hypothetical protein
MKTYSTVLLLTSMLVLSAICSGQHPSDKKPLKHFAADIIHVDSILSVASAFNRQRALLIPLHYLKCHKDFIRFELCKETSSVTRIPQ